MPEEKAYVLSGSDVSTLREIVAAYRSGDLGRPQQVRVPRSAGYPCYMAYTGAGGIAAMTSSDSTPGSGTVTLYRFADDDSIEAVTDDAAADVTVTAWNMSSEAVAGSVYIQLKTEAITGRYLVDFERC